MTFAFNSINVFNFIYLLHYDSLSLYFRYNIIRSRWMTCLMRAFFVFPGNLFKFLKLCPSKTQGILLSSWPLEDTYKLTHTVLSAVILNLLQDLEPQFLSVTFLHLQNQTMVLLLYFQVSVTRASLVILVSVFLGWPWRNMVQFLQ